MIMKKYADVGDAIVSFRISEKNKQLYSNLAEAKGQSLAEWVRRAMQEQADKESDEGEEYVRKKELEKAIAAALNKIKAEEEENK